MNSLRERLLKRVAVNSAGCWIWTSTKCKKGYGRFAVKGKTYMAHRLAYTVFNQAIPDGLCVLHKCDVPSCINPDHLFIGTRADNVRDMYAKGREARGATHGSRTKPGSMASGDKHGSRTKPECFPKGAQHGRFKKPESCAVGERHGQAKLTQAQVDQVKEMIVAGTTQPSIAAHFGVSRSTISRIWRGETWVSGIAPDASNTDMGGKA